MVYWDWRCLAAQYHRLNLAIIGPTQIGFTRQTFDIAPHLRLFQSAIVIGCRLIDVQQQQRMPLYGIPIASWIVIEAHYGATGGSLSAH